MRATNCFVSLVKSLLTSNDTGRLASVLRPVRILIHIQITPELTEGNCIIFNAIMRAKSNPSFQNAVYVTFNILSLFSSKQTAHTPCRFLHMKEDLCIKMQCFYVQFYFFQPALTSDLHLLQYYKRNTSK